ncbi:thiamine-monophosphate kinase [mine drainage metagenome]|uniref:Thiamine-monophosphate kinase n=1 Tax=mine drainage metagenome TaxID=410659 RepID=A0A1J5QVJ4_9ZZZZ
MTIPGEGQINSVGEFGLIAEITALLPQGENVLIGPGDDAAVVTAPDGYVVATTDMAVEGIHFRRDWSSAAQIGQKISAANLADVVSMGARPTAMLVAFAAPRSLPVQWAMDVTIGIRDEAAKMGASIVGGDLASNEKIVISITALGSLDGRQPVLRSGAKVGDRVVLVGTTGLSAAGLALLNPSEVIDSIDADNFEELRAAHRTPKVEYELALAFAKCGAHSMCDVSDGLLADLGHVAQSSGVRCRIDPRKLDVSKLTDAALKLGVDPLMWALTGGEDHAFVGTIAADVELPDGLRVIGDVVAGSGVEVSGLDVSKWQAGHDHFQSTGR